MDKTSKLVRLITTAIVASIVMSGLLMARPPRPRPAVRRAIHRRRVINHRRLPRLRRLPPYRRVWIRRIGPKVVLQEGKTVIYKDPPVVVKTVEELQTIPAPTTTIEQKSTAYKVATVESDCTIVLTNNGQEMKVRMLGVTPIYADQSGENIETTSRQFINNLLNGEFVYLQYDPDLPKQDQSGCTVAYLYRAPDNLFLNLEIIRQGYGLASSNYPHKYSDLFRFYQQKAQADGKGIWTSVEMAKTTPRQTTDIAQVGNR